MTTPEINFENQLFLLGTAIIRSESRIAVEVSLKLMMTEDPKNTKDIESLFWLLTILGDDNQYQLKQ